MPRHRSDSADRSKLRAGACLYGAARRAARVPQRATQLPRQLGHQENPAVSCCPQGSSLVSVPGQIDLLKRPKISRQRRQADVRFGS
jgi:hypothetical protein